MTSQIHKATTKKGKAPAVPSNAFCCFCAIDARRGLYYQFNWEQHSAAARASDDTEGSAWEVVPAKTKVAKEVVFQESEDEVSSEDEYVAKSDNEDDSQASEGEASSDGQTEAEDEDELSSKMSVENPESVRAIAPEGGMFGG